MVIIKKKSEKDLLPEIVERWSTKFFSSEAVPEEDLEEMILAASLAPSAFNEQPWRFFVASSPEDREMVLTYLAPNNQAWAKEAPVLIVVAGAIYETHNGLFNYWGAFDSGSAWGYLSLEAQRKGYMTHCMGGFDRNDLKGEFGLGDNHELYGVIALGKPGDQALQAAEKPSGRRPLSQIMLKRVKSK